jgi:hypothetical protein
LQLVSSENPFETVRLSSLALLREEISAALGSEGGGTILQDGSFWDVLAPIIIALPETDPPFGDLTLEQALQDSTVPWIMECVKVLLLLLSPGSSVEKVALLLCFSILQLLELTILSWQLAVSGVRLRSTITANLDCPSQVSFR